MSEAKTEKERNAARRTKTKTKRHLDSALGEVVGHGGTGGTGAYDSNVIELLLLVLCKGAKGLG